MAEVLASPPSPPSPPSPSSRMSANDDETTNPSVAIVSSRKEERKRSFMLFLCCLARPLQGRDETDSQKRSPRALRRRSSGEEGRSWFRRNKKRRSSFSPSPPASPHSVVASRLMPSLAEADLLEMDVLDLRSQAHLDAPATSSRELLELVTETADPLQKMEIRPTSLDSPESRTYNEYGDDEEEGEDDDMMENDEAEEGTVETGQFSDPSFPEFPDRRQSAAPEVEDDDRAAATHPWFDSDDNQTNPASDHDDTNSRGSSGKKELWNSLSLRTASLTPTPSLDETTKTTEEMVKTVDGADPVASEYYRKAVSLLRRALLEDGGVGSRVVTEDERMFLQGLVSSLPSARRKTVSPTPPPDASTITSSPGSRSTYSKEQRAEIDHFSELAVAAGSADPVEDDEDESSPSPMQSNNNVPANVSVHVSPEYPTDEEKATAPVVEEKTADVVSEDEEEALPQPQSMEERPPLVNQKKRRPPDETPSSPRSRTVRHKNRVELSLALVDDENDVHQEIEVRRVPSNRSSEQKHFQRSSTSSLPSITDMTDGASPMSAEGEFDKYSAHVVEDEDPDRGECVTPKARDSKETPEGRDDEEEALVRYDGWNDVSPTQKGEGAGLMTTDTAFLILGTSVSDITAKPHVMSPPLLEVLQSFLPYTLSMGNFWMKYSMIRDGSSLSTLVARTKGSHNAILAVETLDGDVFGSFTSTTWEKQAGYFGSGEAFLWRLKRSRLIPAGGTGDWSHEDDGIDREVEMYPFTGVNNYVQLCTDDVLAVGGGEWEDGDCPFPSEASGGAGIWMDDNLEEGQSKPCATFASPRLSSTELFSIRNVEVWTVTPCYTEEEAKKLEWRKTFVAQHRVS